MVVTLEEEIKRNPELSRVDLESLREWCNKQPHLPEITDSELALFLHSNYYRIEPTKKTIDAFYTMRTHTPDFFTCRDVEKDAELKRMLSVQMDVVLKGSTRDGYQIVYAAFLNPEPSLYNFQIAMRLLTMVIDLWLRDAGTIKGHIILVDLKGLAFGHVGRCSPITMMHFIYYLQDGLPVRLKGLHFINTNPIMDILLSMAKPFMKKELLDVLHLHQKPEGLEAFNIPLEILPNESGGKAGSQKDLYDEQIQKFKENREWFMEDEKKRRVEESKRPGQAKSASDIFGGLDGSFKKLDLD